MPVLLDTSYLINRMYDHDEVHDRQAVLALVCTGCHTQALTEKTNTVKYSLTGWGKRTHKCTHMKQ